MGAEPIIYSDALRVIVLGLVDRYRAAAGCADSAVGRAALGDSSFVLNLRHGRCSCTLAKLRRLETWLLANLPAVESERTAA